MDTISTQRGQHLPLRLTFYSDADKSAPVDLSSATVRMRETSTSLLADLTPIISDAAAGQVDITLDEETTQALGSGRVNWMKLEAELSDGSNIVVPKIWIHIDE